MKLPQVLFAALAAILISGQPAVAVAATFVENFNDGVLDPSLNLHTDPGFSLALSAGKALVSKSSGVGNGDLSIITDFTILGDFVTTVKADRLNLTGGPAEMGLRTHHALGFTDVFLIDSNGINANIAVNPGFGFQTLTNSSSPVTLRIRRVGNSIFEEYDTGSGFQTLHTATHANLAGPVTIDLFLLQEYGSTAAHSGTFDDFTITADQIVPEPSSLVLLAGGCWLPMMWYLSRRRKRL